MGDKITAKKTMKDLGVPCVPGSDGIIKNFEQAREVTKNIQLKVLQTINELFLWSISRPKHQEKL